MGYNYMSIKWAAVIGVQNALQTLEYKKGLKSLELKKAKIIRAQNRLKSLEHKMG